MDPFLNFLLEHWILSTTFIVLAVIFFFNEWRNRSLGISQVTNQQLVDLLNREKVIVLDIRPAALYLGGHILGAANLPKDEIMANFNILNKYKDKPVILVCAGGTDSPKLGRLLKAQHGMQISALAGGMENWHAQGMPVVKGEAK